MRNGDTTEAGRVDVSICALTFRRPAGLARLHETVSRLKLPDGLRVEWVLVDNDPEASACSASERFEHAGNIPIVWVHEPTGDTARARNRAVDTARGEWIAWVDDDETVAEDWLAAYVAVSEQLMADGFFGPVLSSLEDPSLEGPDLASFYERPRYPTGDVVQYPRTGNGFVRRRVHQEGPFDPEFGFSFGEDVDCFLGAIDRGARFLCCDEAVVVEWIPQERHSARYVLRRAFESDSAWARIESRRSAYPRGIQVLMAILRLAASITLLPIAAVRGRVSRLLGLRAVCRHAGRLSGALGQHTPRESY